jgi:hypothetical protein
MRMKSYFLFTIQIYGNYMGLRFHTYETESGIFSKQRKGRAFSKWTFINVQNGKPNHFLCLKKT